jgi:hypothetical protein
MFGGGNLGTYNSIYWLDGNRVLFPGYDLRGAGQKEASTLAEPGVYIWDSESGRATRHADLQKPMWFLCFNHGFIAYSIAGSPVMDSQKTVMAGPVGTEKQLSIDIFWAKNPELDKCNDWPKRVQTRDPFTSTYVLTYTLSPADGYLYIARGQGGREIDITNENDQVKMFRPGQSQPVLLPILAKEMDSAAHFTYSAYAKLYVLVPLIWRKHDIADPHLGWPKDEPVIVYEVSSSGKVETVLLPPGSSHPMGAFPTRRGMFWISNDAPSGNSADAGGWLFENGHVTKLFDGIVNGASVSDDGCKIAFANDNRSPGAFVEVKVIDLCAAQRS